MDKHLGGYSGLLTSVVAGSSRTKKEMETGKKREQGQTEEDLQCKSVVADSETDDSSLQVELPPLICTPV